MWWWRRTGIRSALLRRTFEQRLSASGQSLDGLSLAAGAQLMAEFFANERVRGCRLDRDEDMLLFQWGNHDWGRGLRFDIDITRQVIRGSAEDDDIWQLSLTFSFPPQNEIVEGNRWCHRPDHLPEFNRFVVGSPAYAFGSAASPLEVQLLYECAG